MQQIWKAVITVTLINVESRKKHFLTSEWSLTGNNILGLLFVCNHFFIQCANHSVIRT
jgi:hypothetical protein